MLVFGAGFILGAIRIPLLVPRLGERWAELLEMPIMLAVIVIAAHHIVARFAPSEPRVLLVVGLFALSILVLAEISLVLLLQHQSLRDYISHRDPVSGTAYLIALGLYAAMPVIVFARGRRTRS